MAALRLKLWWINLSTGKKTLIIFLSSFLVLVTAIAIAIPVTMAVIEEMNTHRPVPGTYVTQDEGATATLVLRKEEDLAGSQRRVDYVLPSDDQYLRKDEKCLVNAFSFHGGDYSFSLTIEKDGRSFDVLYAECYTIPKADWNRILSRRAYPSGSLKSVPEEELKDYYNPGFGHSLKFTEKGILVMAFLEPEGLGSLSFEFAY